MRQIPRNPQQEQHARALIIGREECVDPDHISGFRSLRRSRSRSRAEDGLVVPSAIRGISKLARFDERAVMGGSGSSGLVSVGVGARVLSLFFYLLCLHSVGIFLFTRGFLLTRTELPLFSSCSDVFDSPCLSADRGAQGNSLYYYTRYFLHNNNACFFPQFILRVLGRGFLGLLLSFPIQFWESGMPIYNGHIW